MNNDFRKRTSSRNLLEIATNMCKTKYAIMDCYFEKKFLLRKHDKVVEICISLQTIYRQLEKQMMYINNAYDSHAIELDLLRYLNDCGSIKIASELFSIASHYKWYIQKMLLPTSNTKCKVTFYASLHEVNIKHMSYDYIFPKPFMDAIEIMREVCEFIPDVNILTPKSCTSDSAVIGWYLMDKSTPSNINQYPIVVSEEDIDWQWICYKTNGLAWKPKMQSMYINSIIINSYIFGEKILKDSEFDMYPKMPFVFTDFDLFCYLYGTRHRDSIDCLKLEDIMPKIKKLKTKIKNEYKSMTGLLTLVPSLLDVIAKYDKDLADEIYYIFQNKDSNYYCGYRDFMTNNTNLKKEIESSNMVSQLIDFSIESVNDVLFVGCPINLNVLMGY